MLESILQRSERPSEPLPRQVGQTLRGLGKCMRRAVVQDTPACPANLPGKIRILGESIRRVAPHLIDGRSPPRSNPSPNHRNAIQQVISSTVEVLPAGVFHRLPAGQAVLGIPILNVAG